VPVYRIHTDPPETVEADSARVEGILPREIVRRELAPRGRSSCSVR
jgi:hypothetical protein